MVRSMLVLLFLFAAGFAADPPKGERPDPKKWAEKWEKDGVTMELLGAEFGPESAVVVVRVTNGGKVAVTLPGLMEDKQFMAGKEQDTKSPLYKIALADDFGGAVRCVIRAGGWKGEGEHKLEPGDKTGVTLVFARPPVSSRYYLTVPGEHLSAAGDVRFSFPASAFKPSEPKKK